MIRYRNMRRDELDLVLEWAAGEGWNPGLDDAAAFWAAGSDGFFVACVEDAPVAAISVVAHSDAFAFLGLYLCHPSHRGRGIGLSLWQHAMSSAGDRVVGLDGVPAQQANYETSGFHRAGETVRHVGRIDGSRSETIRGFRPGDLSALVALEARASGWSKPAYMTAWFRPAPTRTTFVSERNGTMDGAVTVRRCRSGAKIGPLIAPDGETALNLTRAAASVMGDALSIDVPESAADFAALLRAEGFSESFRTARMYRGPFRRPAPTLHAVGSLELG